MKVAETTGDLVGDVFGDLPIHGRCARLELGLKRVQRSLNRTQILNGGDRVEPRAQLAEKRLKPARADLGVRKPIELVADLSEHRLRGAGIGVGESGRVAFGVEIAQELFDRARIDWRRRTRLKGLTHALDAARQLVERA